MDEAPGDLQTIDEIVSLAILEPDVRSVFVEGASDAAFFQWFIEENGIDASVYAVADRLYVPRDDSWQGTTDYGERDKLMMLAVAIDQEPKVRGVQVTVVIDADWSEALGPQPLASDCMFTTVVPSIEFIGLEERPLRKFLRVGLSRRDVGPEEVRSAIGGALRAVASARLVLTYWNCPFVENFAVSCVLEVDNSGADVRALIMKSLSGIPKAEWPRPLDDLVHWAERYHELLTTASHPGRGHDIAPLLIRYLGLKNDLARPAVIERLLREAIELADLVDRKPFQQLVERFAA